MAIDLDRQLLELQCLIVHLILQIIQIGICGDAFQPQGGDDIYTGIYIANEELYMRQSANHHGSTAKKTKGLIDRFLKAGFELTQGLAQPIGLRKLQAEIGDGIQLLLQG